MDDVTNSQRDFDPILDGLSFLAHCLTYRASSNAQLLQDLWVLYDTRMKRSGYFVEFGAADGVIHSNTLILERDFGWSGLLAEPNPDQYDALRSNRSARIDRRCVWDKSGMQLDLLVTDDPELSTVTAAAVTDAHTAARLSSTRLVTVETVSLNDLLDQHDAPRMIDFLSIDVEGGELSVLTKFDFEARDIRLIAVEHNHRADKMTLDTIMARNGYERRFAEYSDFDAWYRKVQL